MVVGTASFLLNGYPDQEILGTKFAAHMLVCGQVMSLRCSTSQEQNLKGYLTYKKMQPPRCLHLPLCFFLRKGGLLQIRASHETVVRVNIFHMGGFGSRARGLGFRV